jgi:hypothetical protein
LSPLPVNQAEAAIPGSLVGVQTAREDTRAIQHYLGHRSIASTLRYTALAPDRFRNFWKD